MAGRRTGRYHIKSSRSPLIVEFAQREIEVPPPTQEEHSTTEDDLLSTEGLPGSGVRRHQSLTYGAHQAKQRASAPLKRSGTMLATASRRSAQPPPEIQDEDEEDDYAHHQEQTSQEEIPHYPQLESQILQPGSRQSPWGPPQKDWHGPTGSNSSYGLVGPQIDDVQRALATLDLGAGQINQQIQPPRFNKQPVLRNSPSNPHLRQDNRDFDLDANIQGAYNSNQYRGLTGRALPQGAQSPHSTVGTLRRPASATGNDVPDYGGNADRQLRSRLSNPNLQYGSDRDFYGSSATSALPPVPQIPAQYLNQGTTIQPPRLGANPVFSNSYIHNPIASYATNDSIGSPAVDIPTLIATKGYNPVNFDTKPVNVTNTLFISLTVLSRCYFRQDILSSSHTLKTMSTSHSNMKFGALPTPEINDLTRPSKNAEDTVQFTFSSVSMPADISVALQKC
jgi:YTH domain-containing family protein